MRCARTGCDVDGMVYGHNGECFDHYSDSRERELRSMYRKAEWEKEQEAAKKALPRPRKVRKTYPRGCSLGSCRCGACHLDPWEALK